MEDFSLSDIAAATGGNGMNSNWILILLFAMIFGWNGNGFGGNNSATDAIQRAVDLNSIKEGQGAIGADVQRAIYEINSATGSAAYNNLSEIRDVESAMNVGFANQSKCCCETLRAIDGVNYNISQSTASINANTTAQTQKILDQIAANRIHELEGKVSELQMQAATCGVVRYPSASTYYAGNNPFGTCGCGASI